MRARLLGAMLLSMGFVVAGCQAEEAADEAEPGTAAETVADTAQLPDTTAASLWAYLQEVDYPNTWQLWPGKGELYQGQDPHGAILTTYLNPAAYQALTGDAGAMPVNAIVVKENYMPDSTLAAVTTMYKVSGYNPDHNDWYFAKQGPDGSVEAAGRAQGCQACHGTQADNDYIMTESLSGM